MLIVIWDEEELELRKAKLSEMALEIWEYPTTSYVPLQEEEDIVSLSEDNGIATNRDIQFFIFQEERTEVSTWTEMMWEMAQKLFAINPAILYQEARGDKNVWFATTQFSKAYRQLANGLYFCPGNSSTWNKMAILKNLFRIYRIDEDDLSFGLLPKKDDAVDTAAVLMDGAESRYTKRKRFWTEFIQYCEENNGLFVNISPVTSSWISKSLKVPHRIDVNAVVGFDFDRVEVYIDDKEKDLNKAIFDYLYAKKEEIENEYGGRLFWERLSENRACRIKDEIQCHTFEIDNWTEVFAFMKSAGQRMFDVFHKYISEWSTYSQS